MFHMLHLQRDTRAPSRISRVARVRRWSAALARSRSQQIVLSVTCLFARIAAIHLSFPLLSRSAATDLSLLSFVLADFLLLLINHVLVGRLEIQAAGSFVIDGRAL